VAAAERRPGGALSMKRGIRSFMFEVLNRLLSSQQFAALFDPG
jgi:hypothetical protein